MERHDGLYRYAGTYSYLYDGKGNVSAVVKDDGTVAAAYAYDEFGNIVGESGTLDQPYRFSTKRYYDDYGLSYYGYRFYDGQIGRWLTRDPLGEAGGLNLYAFVGNNPINAVDAWGWEPRSTIGGDDPGFDNPEETIRNLEEQLKDNRLSQREKERIRRRINELRRKKSNRQQHHCEGTEPPCECPIHTAYYYYKNLFKNIRITPPKYPHWYPAPYPIPPVPVIP